MYYVNHNYVHLLLPQALFLITVFVIGYFIGGVVNIIQFVDVNSLSMDCGDTRKVCQALERLAGCQIASFVSYSSITIMHSYVCT